MISPISPPVSDDALHVPDACMCSMCCGSTKSSSFFSSHLFLALPHVLTGVSDKQRPRTRWAHTGLAGGLSGQSKAWGWCHGIPRAVHIKAPSPGSPGSASAPWAPAALCEVASNSWQAQLPMGQTVQYLRCTTSRCFSSPLE